MVIDILFLCSHCSMLFSIVARLFHLAFAVDLRGDTNLADAQLIIVQRCAGSHESSFYLVKILSE